MEAKLAPRAIPALATFLIAALGFLSAAFFPVAASAQADCGAPRDLRVCQDVYGERGRVFLVWTNGEPDYSKVRLYVDDVLAAEGAGDSRIGYVNDLAPGLHAFAVEGACGSTFSARASQNFTVLAESPHAQPASAFVCNFDETRSRLTASWTLGARPSLFIDVYLRRAGVAGRLYVTTIAGDQTSLSIDGAQATDRLQLQFFDRDCYGSPLVGCPGPDCAPPVALRVCQDLYGASSRVFLLWVGAPVDYSAFEILVDGAQVAQVEANRGLHYVDALTPGEHTFGVRGVCDGAPTEALEKTFTVLSESPHSEPVRNFHCERDLVQHTVTATWLPGAHPSEFIDVYLRKPGVQLLEYIGTVEGASTRLRVQDTGAEDEVVLQFFNSGCYGSPLVSCGDAPGTRQFVRGDSDGSGVIELTDAVFSLRFLFLGDAEPLCLDAGDSNDDSRVDVADPVFVLNWLFSGGSPPPAPGPETCGDDPSADALPPCLTGACP